MNILNCLGSVTKMKKRACCEHLGDTSNLDTLRKMTLGLSTMHRGEAPYYGDIELKIYEQANIEIVYVAAKKGTVFPQHSHALENETIAISKGKVSLETGALTSVFRAGEFIFLEKKLLHKVTILEDVILIVTFLKTMNGLCNAGN